MGYYERTNRKALSTIELNKLIKEISDFYKSANEKIIRKQSWTEMEDDLLNHL